MPDTWFSIVWKGHHGEMNLNSLHIVIAALVAALLVVGYLYYNERQHTARMDISVGKDGISVETK
jgi:hypothetical protein